MRLGSRKLTISMLVVLFGSLAMLLSACGGGSTSSGPTDLAADQTFNYGWATGSGTDITTLDPGQASDTSAIPLVDLLFDGLVTLDSNLKVENWGADKIDVSPDGKTYTFHIRDGQAFSDGTPVKASDYAYGMDRTLNPCFQSPINYYLWTIHNAQTFSSESCDENGNITAADGQTDPVVTTLIGDSIIPDDSAKTLKVVNDAPAGYFLSAMTYSSSYAVEQKVVKAEGDKNLGLDAKWLDTMTQGAHGQGGSGMFYLSQWDHKSIVQMKANPNWWGLKANPVKKPFLQTLNFKLYSSSDTEYADYQTGSAIDIAGVPSAQVAAAKNEDDYHEGSILSFENVQFNWKIAPFDNIEARKAFCLAVNRDLLNSSVFKGLQKPMWNIVPPGMPGYQPNFKGIDGAGTGDNSAAAKQHWDAYKASLNGAPIPAITYSFNPSSQTAINYAQALQGMWNQTLDGSNVQLNSNDWASALKLERQGKLQMFRFGWLADYPDPQDFLTLLWSSDSSYNYSNGGVPEADAKMKQADAIYQTDAASVAQRLKLYNDAERILVDNVVTCPEYTGTTHYRVRTFVKNYAQTSQAQPSLDQWLAMYIAKH